MWIFSQDGFFSIVQKPDGYHVRARRKEDLVRVGLTPIKSFSGSDYPWRTILNQTEHQKLMQTLGNSVDYPNFKGKIAKREDQWQRLHRYHKIWAIMAEESDS
jgi:hypothetical protein